MCFTSSDQAPDLVSDETLVNHQIEGLRPVLRHREGIPAAPLHALIDAAHGFHATGRDVHGGPHQTGQSLSESLTYRERNKTKI